MGVSPWITCLWPGLPRLWYRGQVSGLVSAVLFAVWLNGALADTFLLAGLQPMAQAANWSVLTLVWLACVHRGASRLSQFHGVAGHFDNEPLLRAQEEYVKGHWFEAESLLLRLIRDEPSDVEGRLLLATLYRHTARLDLALTQLDQAARYPHAQRWTWEIHQERVWIQRAKDQGASQAEEPMTQSDSSSTTQENPPAAPTNDSGDEAGEPDHRGDSSAPAPGDTPEAQFEVSQGNGGLSKAA